MCVISPLITYSILKDCSKDEFSNILLLLILKMYAQSNLLMLNITYFLVFTVDVCISGKEKFNLLNGLIMGGHDLS